MNEKNFREYLSQMLGLAQKYQKTLMWSEDIHINIDVMTCDKAMSMTIWCHTYKDDILQETVYFTISENDSWDAVGVKMQEFVKFVAPYLP